jgi:hypothetical protein
MLIIKRYADLAGQILASRADALLAERAGTR